MTDRLEDNYIAGVVTQLCDLASQAWAFDRPELAEWLFVAAVRALDGAEFPDPEPSRRATPKNRGGG